MASIGITQPWQEKKVEWKATNVGNVHSRGCQPHTLSILLGFNNCCHITLEIGHMNKYFSCHLMQKMAWAGHEILELASENVWHALAEPRRCVISRGLSLWPMTHVMSFLRQNESNVSRSFGEFQWTGSIFHVQSLYMVTCFLPPEF